MTHIEELIARRACVHGGQGSDGFRGVVVQDWNGIGRLLVNPQRIQRTDEQQFHPGTSAADVSSMTMTSAVRVGFAERDDSDEWYVVAIPCEASMLEREGNSVGTTPTERVIANPISHSLVVDERGTDELRDGMTQYERRKLLSFDGPNRNHQATELSLFGKA